MVRRGTGGGAGWTRRTTALAAALAVLHTAAAGAHAGPPRARAPVPEGDRGHLPPAPPARAYALRTTALQRDMARFAEELGGFGADPSCEPDQARLQALQGEIQPLRHAMESGPDFNGHLRSSHGDPFGTPPTFRVDIARLTELMEEAERASCRHADQAIPRGRIGDAVRERKRHEEEEGGPPPPLSPHDALLADLGGRARSMLDRLQGLLTHNVGPAEIREDLLVRYLEGVLSPLRSLVVLKRSWRAGEHDGSSFYGDLAPRLPEGLRGEDGGWPELPEPYVARDGGQVAIDPSAGIKKDLGDLLSAGTTGAYVQGLRQFTVLTLLSQAGFYDSLARGGPAGGAAAAPGGFDVPLACQSQIGVPLSAEDFREDGRAAERRIVDILDRHALIYVDPLTSPDNQFMSYYSDNRGQYPLCDKTEDPFCGRFENARPTPFEEYAAARAGLGRGRGAGLPWSRREPDLNDRRHFEAVMEVQRGKGERAFSDPIPVLLLRQLSGGGGTLENHHGIQLLRRLVDVPDHFVETAGAEEEEGGWGPLAPAEAPAAGAAPPDTEAGALPWFLLWEPGFSTGPEALETALRVAALRSALRRALQAANLQAFLHAALQHPDLRRETEEQGTSALLAPFAARATPGAVLDALTRAEVVDPRTTGALAAVMEAGAIGQETIVSLSALPTWIERGLVDQETAAANILTAMATEQQESVLLKLLTEAAPEGVPAAVAEAEAMDQGTMDLLASLREAGAMDHETAASLASLAVLVEAGAVDQGTTASLAALAALVEAGAVDQETAAGAVLTPMKNAEAQAASLLERFSDTTPDEVRDALSEAGVVDRGTADLLADLMEKGAVDQGTMAAWAALADLVKAGAVDQETAAGVIVGTAVAAEEGGWGPLEPAEAADGAEATPWHPFVGVPQSDMDKAGPPASAEAEATDQGTVDPAAMAAALVEAVEAGLMDQETAAAYISDLMEAAPPSTESTEAEGAGQGAAAALPWFLLRESDFSIGPETLETVLQVAALRSAPRRALQAANLQAALLETFETAHLEAFEEALQVFQGDQAFQSNVAEQGRYAVLTPFTGATPDGVLNELMGAVDGQDVDNRKMMGALAAVMEAGAIGQETMDSLNALFSWMRMGLVGQGTTFDAVSASMREAEQTAASLLERHVESDPGDALAMLSEAGDVDRETMDFLASVTEAGAISQGTADSLAALAALVDEGAVDQETAAGVVLTPMWNAALEAAFLLENFADTTPDEVRDALSEAGAVDQGTADLLAATMEMGVVDPGTMAALIILVETGAVDQGTMADVVWTPMKEAMMEAEQEAASLLELFERAAPGGMDERDYMAAVMEARGANRRQAYAVSTFLWESGFSIGRPVSLEAAPRVQISLEQRMSDLLEDRLEPFGGAAPNGAEARDFLTELMEKRGAEQETDLISEALKARLQGNEVLMDMPALHGHDFSRQWAIDALAVFTRDQGEARGVRRAVREACRAPPKSMEVMISKDPRPISRSVREFCGQGDGPEEAKAVMDGVADFLRGFTNFTPSCKGRDDSGGHNLSCPQRIDVQRLAPHYPFLRRLWTALRTHVPAFAGLSRTNEHDYIVHQVNEARNPWARVRLAYLVAMDELTFLSTIPTPWQAPSGGLPFHCLILGMAPDWMQPAHCEKSHWQRQEKFLERVRTIMERLRSAASAMGIDRVLTPNYANAMLSREEKTEIWEDVAKSSDDKSHSLFSVPFPGGRDLYDLITAADVRTFHSMIDVKEHLDAIQDDDGNSVFTSEDMGRIRKDAGAAVCAAADHRPVTIADARTALSMDVLQGHFSEEIRDEDENVIRREYSRGLIDSNGNAMFPEACETDDRLDLDELNDRDFNHVVRFLGELSDAKGDAERQAETLRNNFTSPDDPLLRKASQYALMRDDAFKSAMYRTMLRKAASIRKGRILERLEDLCSFDTSNHEKMVAVFHATARAQAEVHRIMGVEETPEEILEVLEGMSPRDWMELKVAGLFIASIVAVMVLTSVTASMPVLAAATALSGAAPIPIWGALLWLESIIYMDGQRGGALVRSMEDVRATDPGSASEVERTPFWLGFELATGPVVFGFGARAFEIGGSLLAEAGKKNGLHRVFKSVSAEAAIAKHSVRVANHNITSPTAVLGDGRGATSRVREVLRDAGSYWSKFSQELLQGDIVVASRMRDIDRWTAVTIAKGFDNDPRSFLRFFENYSGWRLDRAKRTVDTFAHKGLSTEDPIYKKPFSSPILRFRNWHRRVLVENKDAILRLQDNLQGLVRSGDGHLETFLVRHMDDVVAVFRDVPMRASEFPYRVSVEGFYYMFRPYFSRPGRLIGENGLVVKYLIQSREWLIHETTKRAAREALGLPSRIGTHRQAEVVRAFQKAHAEAYDLAKKRYELTGDQRDLETTVTLGEGWLQFESAFADQARVLLRQRGLHETTDPKELLELYFGMKPGRETKWADDILDGVDLSLVGGRALSVLDEADAPAARVAKALSDAKDEGEFFHLFTALRILTRKAHPPMAEVL